LVRTLLQKTYKLTNNVDVHEHNLTPGPRSILDVGNMSISGKDNENISATADSIRYILSDIYASSSIYAENISIARSSLKKKAPASDLQDAEVHMSDGLDIDWCERLRLILRLGHALVA